MRITSKIFFRFGFQFLKCEILKRFFCVFNLPLYFPPNLINARVTLKCNLSCKQCWVWQKNSIDDLSTNEWKKIILNIKNSIGPFFLRFYGGEPFCRNDLLDLISFSSQNEISSLITTNGTYINRSVANELVRNKLILMQISLDGMRPETHDILRGVEGTYRKAMSAIELLQGKVPIQINTTIMQNNLDEIVDLADFSLKNKIQISFQGILNFDKIDYTRCGFVSQDSYLFPKNLDKINYVIDELIIRKKRYNSSIVNNLTQLKNLKTYYRNPAELNKIHCGAIINNQFTVKETGKVFLCVLYKSIGNVAISPFSDIWNSEEAAQIRKEMRNCDIHACAVLRGCSYETVIDIFKKVKKCLFDI